MTHLPAPTTVQLYDPSEPGMAAMAWIGARALADESPWVADLLVEIVRSIVACESATFVARVALAIDEICSDEGAMVNRFMQDIVAYATKSSLG